MWDLYSLLDVVYKTRAEQLYWEEGQCTIERWGALFYAEDAVCDVSSMEVEGSVDIALLTDDVSREIKNLKLLENTRTRTVLLSLWKQW